MFFLCLALVAGGRLTVVHGDCRDGGDAIAKAWAFAHESWGVIEEGHAAQWRQHGNAAGPIGNAHMVDLSADRCLAFLMPCAKTNCLIPRPHWSHGASHCADLAQVAGIPTDRYYGAQLR